MGARALVIVGVVAAAAAVFFLWPHDPDAGSLPDTESGAQQRETPDLLTADDMTEDAPELVGRGTQPKAEHVARAKASAPDTRPAHLKPGPGRIVGRVRNPDGRPLAEAVVTVRSIGKQGVAPRHVTTNRDGLFAVEGVVDGVFHVTVVIPGHGSASVRTTPGSDLKLTVHPLSQLAGIAVERGTDRPVANLLIEARPSLSPQAGRAWVAYTDSDGHFRVELPANASYVVRYGHRMRDGETVNWIRVTTAALRAGRDDLRFEVSRGLDIAGEIRMEDGTLVTRPVPVVALAITPEGSPDYGNRRRVDSKDGAFRIRGLAPGRYKVTIEPPAPAYGEETPFLAAKTLDGVEAGTENLQVVLSGGQAIAGTLIDEDGQAVTTRGLVFMMPHGKQPGSQEMVYAQLDGKGGFKSPPLDPSTPHRVVANGFRGFMQTNLERVFPGPDPLTITLKKGLFISGRVIDADGAAVAAGIGVVAQAIDGEPGKGTTYLWTYTDRSGHFHLNGLGPFTFSVSAGGGASGYVPRTYGNKVKTGTKDLVLTVEAGVPFSGRLVDAAGKPLKTHSLNAISVPPRGPTNWTKIENEEGRFRFPGVPKGKIRIGVTIGSTYIPLGEYEAPAEDIVLTVPDPEDRKRRRHASR